MAAFLLIVGFLLISVNAWLLYKENRNFKKVFDNKQANIDETNELVAQLRKEMAETIFELQTEIYDIKNNMNISDEKNGNASNDSEKEDEYIIGQENDEEKVESLEDNEEENASTQIISNENGFKVAEVEKLIKEGCSEDEICEKLNLGKGEVLLIRDLYIK